MNTPWSVFSWFIIAVVAILGLLLIFGCESKSSMTYSPSSLAIIPACPAAGLFPAGKIRKRKKRAALNMRP